MVNNKTKQTAKMIAAVYKDEVVKGLTSNETAKHKMIVLLNNVVKVSYERAMSGAQMFQNLSEAFDYISGYLKDQFKDTNFMFTFGTEENDEGVTRIVKCRYGLVNDNLPFVCDADKAFNKLKGK